TFVITRTGRPGFRPISSKSYIRWGGRVNLRYRIERLFSSAPTTPRNNEYIHEGARRFCLSLRGSSCDFVDGFLRRRNGQTSKAQTPPQADRGGNGRLLRPA